MNDCYPDGVFLSGLWRSGSTYIWSRFRAAPGTYCFYEPLNQGLGRLNKKRIARYNPEVTRVNTHPVLEKPYFTEFEPLMKWRGVSGFKRRFAYDRYAMDENEKDDALRQYVASLCAHARRKNLTPVLGFNQTNFRTAWLRRNYKALHIHNDRHPRDIWNSYKRLTAHGNYTYFIIWLTIIERNAAHPLFAPLAKKFSMRGYFEKIFIRPKTFCRRALEDITDEDTYFMVFYLWRASALHALSFSDMVIDINRADEEGYAASCAEKIKTLSGIDIDLSGLRADSGRNEFTVDYAATEDAALKYFPVASLKDFLDKSKIEQRLREIKPEKAALLARLL